MLTEFQAAALRAIADTNGVIFVQDNGPHRTMLREKRKADTNAYRGEKLVDMLGKQIAIEAKDGTFGLVGRPTIQALLRMRCLVLDSETKRYVITGHVPE